MAGAGKSSIGKKLAKHLKLNFVDSDLLIEKKYGKSLQDILSQNGNEKCSRNSLRYLYPVFTSR